MLPFAALAQDDELPAVSDKLLQLDVLTGDGPWVVRVAYDSVYCTGTETCNAGSCQAGTPVACDDGVACTVDSCDEDADACAFAPDDGLCDDGLYCTGTETCDAVNDCQAGTPVVCDDAVACTVDACDDVADACAFTPDDAACDDGVFCDGAEVCDAVAGCEEGTPPACDDGVGCTVDSCDAGSDACVNTADDNLCDDGLYCTGTETCDAVNDCQAGSDPCPGEVCDEGGQQCVACIVSADCDDGVFCDGAEVCNAGVCEEGTPPTCDDGVACTVDSCDTGSDACANVPNDALCDDGTFCDGAETCDALAGCQNGSDPCPGELCDEAADVCVECFTDTDCDDGLFCNGVETCGGGACQAGSDPCSGGEVCDEAGDVCLPGGTDPVVWMSFRGTTNVPGIGNIADDDIVSYDTGSGTWTYQFDGSDVGLTTEIDGLALLPGGDLLLSVRGSATLGGLSVDDSDIVRFTPTSLGTTTSGTFSLYFDGSDVSLTSNGEDVDGVTLHPDGRLIVSTQGSFSGTGASGADEDLFLFTGTLGASTSGSFSQYFDGSDVGFGGNSADDVDAASLRLAGTLLFSAVGTFSVDGLSGNDEDVGEFAGTFGSSTSGSSTMLLDLSTLGIDASEDVGSVHIVE